MNAIPFSTQRSLATTQLGRNSFKEVLESPLREAALKSFRRQNAFLDGAFYDVGKIADEEAFRKVMVFQWPKGAAAWRRCPQRPQPRNGAMLVLIQVSSINTRREASILP
ncbi:hypothetical protein [Bradyrhizobium elkanii]